MTTSAAPAPAPASAPAPAPAAAEMPCSIKGLSAAFAAGSLGFFFGFFPSMFRLRQWQWGAWCMDGWRSAGSLALCSGVYTTVQCVCQRLRQHEDVWNRCTPSTLYCTIDSMYFCMYFCMYAHTSVQFLTVQ